MIIFVMQNVIYLLIMKILNLKRIFSILNKKHNYALTCENIKRKSFVFPTSLKVARLLLDNPNKSLHGEQPINPLKGSPWLVVSVNLDRSSFECIYHHHLVELSVLRIQNLYKASIHSQPAYW